MWKNWEQLRCVAHSTLIVSLTTAIFGTCIARRQCGRVYVALQKNCCDNEKGKLSLVLKKFRRQSQSMWTCAQKNQNSIQSWHNCIDFPLVATVIPKLRSSLNLYTFNLQSCKITFSVSNNAIERSPDFGPDSVILTVINTCPRNDKGSQEIFTGGLELVFVSETRLLEKSLGLNPNYSQPARNTWDEGHEIKSVSLLITVKNHSTSKKTESFTVPI